MGEPAEPASGRRTNVTAGRFIHLAARSLCGAVAIVGLWFVTGCERPVSGRMQGYIEGEFVYVASPRAGTLEKLAVRRGAEVKAEDLLFELENKPEKNARDEAERRLAQGRATLADLMKGKRPPEIEALQAQLQQARSALELAENEVGRQEKLMTTAAATTEQELDRVRATRNQDRQKVTELEAELELARLGARPDEIAAAEANVQALEAALASAAWDLEQKRQMSPQAGLVFDTLYREGEWVASGRPVVSLLPPANVKLRVFVPEPALGSLRLGDAVTVSIDGVNRPLTAKVSYISPHAEYTPPVIYSRENRAKFVFLVEAIFATEDAQHLHPGQPVDVQLPPAASR